MRILDWIYSEKKERDYLKLIFDKNENHWQVMKGMEIIYLGSKEECRQFMNFNNH